MHCTWRAVTSVDLKNGKHRINFCSVVHQLELGLGVVNAPLGLQANYSFKNRCALQMCAIWRCSFNVFVLSQICYTSCFDILSVNQLTRIKSIHIYLYIYIYIFIFIYLFIYIYFIFIYIYLFAKKLRHHRP